ncbi:MAG: gamma-glutamylcyclotransferase family protein [Gammaproteobacteria bacterium]
MNNRLFVYGTLRPGEPNEHILADIDGDWQPASVHGTLLPQGWGAALGYPGIMLNESAGEVQGLLFSSVDLPSHWSRLDEFEGPGYERVMASVKLQDGTVVEAQIYVLSESPAA